MRANLIRLTFIILLSFFPFFSNAQKLEPFIRLHTGINSTSKNFRYLTVNDGFYRSAILDIMQTRNGMMWFAAWDGLYSFDGYKLKRVCQIFHSRDEEPAVITSIIEGQPSQIWMITDDGLYIWDDANKTTTDLNHITEGKHNIQAKIKFIKKDDSGIIWMIAKSGQLFAYDQSMRHLQEVSVPDRAIMKDIRNLYIDEDNNKWICTKHNGVFRIKLAVDLQQGELVRDSIFNHFNKTNVHCVYQDKKKHFWVGTAKGIYRFKNSTNSTEENSYMIMYPENLNQNEINIFNFAEHNEKIFAATNIGLFTYKSESAQWILPNPNNGGLNNKSIRNVFIDEEGGLWLGTFNGGVNYLSPTAENFTVFSYLNNKIKGHVISGFAEDKEHNLWISSEDGGLYYWNRSTDEIQRFNQCENGLFTPTRNNIQALFLNKNHLYLGLYDGGFDVINLTSKTKTNYNFQNTFPNPLPLSVYAFNQINDKDILLGTIDGLYLFNENTHKVHKISNDNSKVNCIIKDQEQDIWVGCKSGITHYAKDLTVKKHFAHDANDSTSLGSNNITALAFFGSTLYIGTNGKGMWTVQKDKTEFRRVAEAALRDATIYKIIVDQDNLWISTNIGLYNYNTNTQQTQRYTTLDGLCYNQFKTNSGLMTADHTIFLGSVYGITGFKPHNLVKNNKQPKVLITDLYLFNKAVVPAPKGSPLKESITYSDKIEFHQSQNNFTFKLGSSSYNQTKKNVYEYKLTPLEKEWHKTDEGMNGASYTNIPAGEYTLYVRTSNDNCLWSDTKSLKVNILPFWWASVPIKIGYVLFVFGIIGWMIFRYNRKKKKEIYLLKLEKEKEIYHSKMDFFTFMVHEIRTPLTLILGPLTDVMTRKGTIDDAMDELNTIKRNGNRLLTLVNQLMDFRKVEEKSYMLQWETVDLNEQVRQLAKNFQYNCTQKKIALSLNMPKYQCWVKADKEALNKIITNLLSNAIKFTTDKIEVSLRESPQGKNWEIAVKDNGKGIEKSHHAKIFNSFYQVRQDIPNDYIGTGVGLSVVKHLTELQGGQVKLESELGAGACFTISLPISEVPLATIGENQNEPQEPNRENITQCQTTKRHLLVAEDNEEMRDYIISIFSDEYIVDGCSNGREALDLTRETGYDLILTDWMMPIIDGLELAKILKSQDETCHIPIVILTAKDDESSQIEGFMAHADAYVVKPFSAQILKSQVISIIKNRENIHKEFLKQPDTSEEILCQNDLDKKFIEKLNALIDERITDTSISVDELASHLCMGRTSFYQKVKGVAGVTPNEYIGTYKLKKAAHLLKSGHVRINEICYMIGFSSSSYFAKKFTAQFGMTPTAYLKNAK